MVLHGLAADNKLNEGEYIMFKSVPKRPNLEFDRKQSKALFEALKSTKPEARERFARFHPGGVPLNPKLADAQLVVAREYGFSSWPMWKSFVETRNLDRAKQAEVALKAICSNDTARARVLLQADAELAMEDFYIACACGEVGFVKAALGREPALAKRRGGVNDWEPIEYACFSRWMRADPARVKGIVEVVGLLLNAGANPNASHMMTVMGETYKETVLFAAAGISNNVDLTRMLLEAGADVKDGFPEPDPADPKKSPWGTEPLYHSSEFRDTACLELLLKARPYPLCVSYCLGRALDFENANAVALYLEHGADVNLRVPWFGGRTYLQRAVLAGRSAEIVGMLLDAGADLDAVDGFGFTAYRYAVRNGPKKLEELLEARGGKGATPEDRVFADVVSGRAETVSGMTIHPNIFCAAARRNDVAMLERLINAGANVDGVDLAEKIPPLHWAAWRGHFEAVRCLVEHGADICLTNPYGGDALGTTMHGSENCFDLDGGPGMKLPEEAVRGDYAQIVEYLIAAGAKLPEKIWSGTEAVRDVLRKHGVPDVG
jgi:ankyrin repeat protein